MPVLDTSFLVDLMRGQKAALKILSELEDTNTLLCTTPITALELYRGAYLSTSPEKNLKCVRTIISALLVLPFDDEVYQIFGVISTRLRSEGRPIGDFDEVIASIALRHGQEIITRDKHFLKVPTLTMVQYSSP